MCSSVADGGGQERNGQRFNDILSHCLATLLITPCMRVAPVGGRGDRRQNLGIGLRLLHLASDQRQCQAEQGSAAIRTRYGCLCCFNSVAFTQWNLAQEENCEKTQQHGNETQEEDVGDSS